MMIVYHPANDIFRHISQNLSILLHFEVLMMIACNGMNNPGQLTTTTSFIGIVDDDAIRCYSPLFFQLHANECRDTAVSRKVIQS